MQVFACLALLAAELQAPVASPDLACQHGGYSVLHATGRVPQGDGCLTFWQTAVLAAALGCADNDVTPAAALMYRSSEQGSTLFERLVAALEEHAEGRVIYLTGVHAA